MSDDPVLPLKDIKVVELGLALAGPLAGTMLADMGADVIKVENPEGGDFARQWGPPFGPDGRTSLYFHTFNRNKRSVTLDLKNPSDRKQLHRLCKSTDIFIQNMRQGVMEKMDIGPLAMCRRYPQLIYCNISAFGQDGPLSRNPGFDPLLQAYCGMMSMTGRPDGDPTLCGASINDKAAGMFCVIGALAALHRRTFTGKGGVVDTSLFEAAVHWVEGPLNDYLATGQVPTRHGTGGRSIVPYQAFNTSDHPVVIAAGTDPMFACCAEVLQHPEWSKDERFATGPQRVINKKALIAAMQDALAERTRNDWMQALGNAGVPCSPINDIAELAGTEQLAAVDILHTIPESDIKLVGLPISFERKRPRSERSSPGLGQHNREILESAQLKHGPAK